MPESRLRRWTRRIGVSAATVVAIEFIWLTVIPAPDPLQVAVVYGYNGFQSLREASANAIGRFRQRSPKGPPPDARAVAAFNEFGFDLLRRLAAATPQQNVFFSPYSLSTATTVCANGAGGATRSTLLKTLRLRDGELALANTAQARTLDYLDNTDWRIQAKAASSLWYDGSVAMKPEFVSTVTKQMKADVAEADLHSASGMARLSGWISRNANGQLAGGIPPMGRDEHIAFVNTITFHGRWKDQFKRGNTHPGAFHLEDGTEKSIPMMRRSGAVRATGGSLDTYRTSYTVACLPYGDASMCMLIVLPRHDYRAHVAGLLPLVTAKQVDQWMARMGTAEGGIYMPRFTVKCRPDIDPALKQMGLAPAYRPFVADFSPMGVGKSGLPIYLSRTIHQAYLEVDEEGTRAGAMTIHDYATASESTPIEVNRPFICLIRDNRTGVILFCGVIYDPQEL